MTSSFNVSNIFGVIYFFSFSDVNNIETQTETEIPLRSYQHELAEIGCQGENVIILAPTNSGKTYVACRIIQVRSH